MHRALAFLLIAGFVVSVLPLLPDPYYHKERVCFWVWAGRELAEVVKGERE